MGYLDGFKVTLKQMHKPVTNRYPDEKRPKPVRFHGRHVLNKYEDGMEKCIGCELCAGVCPARCIYVRGADGRGRGRRLASAHTRTPEGPRAGRRTQGAGGGWCRALLPAPRAPGPAPPGVVCPPPPPLGPLLCSPVSSRARLP